MSDIETRHPLSDVGFIASQAPSLRTPCLIYSEKELTANIAAMRTALNVAWGSNYVIGYSVKTASIPACLAHARRQECWAEAVSDEEYDMALASGFTPESILFNGVTKTEQAFTRALDCHGIVNLDSQRELRWAVEYARQTGNPVRVGLRVNFELDGRLSDEAAINEQHSRFGFSWENGDFQRAVERLRGESGGLVHVSGVHLHLTPHHHQLDLFDQMARSMAEVVAWMGHDLDYIDMGGGFAGGPQARDQYGSYISSIAAPLKTVADPIRTTLIVEPGDSLLGSTAVALGRVLDCKDIGDQRFVVTELSRLNLNPHWSDRDYEVMVSSNAAPHASQTICGYTCMEFDRLTTVSDLPELAEGDWVEVRCVGAYTASFMPAFFIKPPQALYWLSAQGKLTALTDDHTPFGTERNPPCPP